MRIDITSALNNLNTSFQRQASTAERTPGELREGLRVSLSELGRNLAPEARQVQLEALQSELAMLNGAWASANANLIKQLQEQGLSDEQMLTATTLAMA